MRHSSSKYHSDQTTVISDITSKKREKEKKGKRGKGEKGKNKEKDMTSIYFFLK